MRLILALLVLVFVAQAAMANPLFGIQPFKAKFQPSGPRSTIVYEFNNPSNEAAAIQLRMMDWQQNVTTGDETDISNTTSFEIYPDQFVLPPQGVQSVRITWRGAVTLPTEQAYRLVAEQLPVNFAPKPGSSAVRFLLTYRAAIYVAPPDAKPGLTVKEFHREADQLVLIIANQGNAHSLISLPRLLLTATDGQTMTLQGDALKLIDNVNLHPGSVRRIAVPWPSPVTELKAVRFDYKPVF